MVYLLRSKEVSVQKRGLLSVKFQAQYSSNMGYFTIDVNITMHTAAPAVFSLQTLTLHFTRRVSLEGI